MRVAREREWVGREGRGVGRDERSATESVQILIGFRPNKGECLPSSRGLVNTGRFCIYRGTRGHTHKKKEEEYRDRNWREEKHSADCSFLRE
jgi:hypothetical protein